MDATTTAETAAVSGSSYFFSSAETALAADADARTDVVHGTTAAEIAVAANPFSKGTGGIFGCPSCLGSDPALIEALKLFLPYFPLHIRQLISRYLQLLDFIHIFDMVQNMMNHMDEYQALFRMFEGMESTSVMPDLSSIKKMMEGSDLVDEFTYVEEPSGFTGDGS